MGLITLLTVSMIIGIFLQLEETQTNSHVTNFIYRYTSSNTTFNVTAKVNLADSVNGDDAIKVAAEVFKVIVGARYALESATVDETGI